MAKQAKQSDGSGGRKPPRGTKGNPPRNEPAGVLGLLSGGALGVGLALVALPAGLLFWGMEQMERVRIVGLPLMAIFGIMILFGSLALVAMLFQSLGLSDNRFPLALPEGSIRAAIALSLIVLFAIISIMLFLSIPGSPYRVDGLTGDQRNAIVGKAPDRVIEVLDLPCAASAPAGAGCADGDRRYTVHLRPGASTETTDLAKQLLILVGTLMTSVTSYYFAARGSMLTGGQKPNRPGDDEDGGGDGDGKGDGDSDSETAADNPSGDAPPGSSRGLTASGESHLDGCDVAITNPTPDEDLPAARGGVAHPGGA